MNTRHAVSILTATAVSVMLFSTTAHGAVIHSNFGVGDTYNIGSFWTVRGPGGGPPDADVAAPFTVGATGATLTTAEMALRNFFGANTMTVSVMSDSGGSPDSILASRTVTGMPTNTAGGIVTVDFTSSSLALAANATYWLMADASGSTFVSWFRNIIGEQGTKQQSNGGGWLTFFPSTSGAFRINGVIPEPSTAVLTGLGALAFAALVRRKN